MIKKNSNRYENPLLSDFKEISCITQIIMNGEHHKVTLNLSRLGFHSKQPRPRRKRVSLQHVKDLNAPQADSA